MRERQLETAATGQAVNGGYIEMLHGNFYSKHTTETGLHAIATLVDLIEVEWCCELCAPVFPTSLGGVSHGQA